MQMNPLDNPMLSSQHDQIIRRNKQLAAQGGGGNSMLGTIGSVIGGALGTAVGGPLGGAVGSSIGGSLGGKGDLSAVTPESIALGAVTAGLGSKLQGAGEAAKGAGEAAKAGGDALQATGNVATMGTNVADNAVKAAGGFDAAGAMSGIQDQLASVGADTVTQSATEAAKNPLFSGIKGVSDRIKDFQAIDPSDIASTAKDSLFETPDTYFEHFANKLYNPIFREEGGPVNQNQQQANKHIIEHRRKLSDLEKAMMLMSPIFAGSQGRIPGIAGALGAGALGVGALGLACGGKAKHY